VNWPLRREVLSRGANVYANVMLGVRVKDATAGFRVYRASALAALGLDDVASKGYTFQIDMTIRTRDSGAGIVEIPIEFREREVGVSKMTGAIVSEAMRMVTVEGIGRRFRQLTRRGAAPRRASSSARAV
jgi:dolichol-phosphate mannosyltransferase